MRLLVRKLYRAFPELDRYSDEQCERFVKATKRGRVARIAHAAIVATVGLTGFVAAAVACAFASEKLFQYQNAQHRDLPWLELLVFLCCVPIIAIGPVGAFVTRDRLLRRRLVYVLRTRSGCPACGYVLIGLGVSPDHKITCPECGMRCDVDPSLGELTLDASGREQYHPSVIAPPRPRFWTARKRRILVRTALAMVLIPALTAGSYELWLRHQASVARRERPGLEALTALAESVQLAGVAIDAENGWTSLQAAIDAMKSADDRTWRATPVKTSDGRDVFPDWTLLYAPRSAPPDENDAAARDLGTRMIGEYRKEGVFDRLREAAASVRAVRPLSAESDMPDVLLPLPYLGQIRQFSRLNSGRMALAVKAGDMAEFARAMEDNLALSKMLQRQGGGLDALVAYAIDSMSFRQLRSALHGHPDAATLDALAAALARQKAGVPKTHFLEGERLVCVDAAAWLFSDPARVRFGRHSPTVKAFVDGVGSRPIPGPLGTYSQNRDAFNAIFETAKANALRRPQDRVQVGMSELVLVQAMVPQLDRFLLSQDEHDLDVAWAELQVALERFRAAHGDYPAALAELVPTFLSDIPLDPWSGRPLCFVRVDPAADRLHRAYLVYSVGVDGTDDGGREQASDVRTAAHTFPGIDFVINCAEPEP